MIDIANFLLRWMFLSNLTRDIAEIQTLPMLVLSPPIYDAVRHTADHHQSNFQPSRNYYDHANHAQNGIVDDPTISTNSFNSVPTSGLPLNYPDEGASGTQHSSSSILRRNILHTKSKPQDDLNVYKEQCWRGILSYPPGSFQRMMVIDALRIELVQQLIYTLRRAEQIVKKFQMKDSFDVSASSGSSTTNVKEGTDSDGRPRRDNDGTDPQSLNEFVESKQSLLLVRSYLPQLVSAVLKSPPPFDGNGISAIHKLRQLIISQCINDPSVGIELCWLLEAEVGRAWKSLFEHRQQSGRRLILVLPADKAIVLAKIGSEKREAFDLLQDAEQATAFGYTDAVKGDNSDSLRNFDQSQSDVNMDENDQNLFDDLDTELSHHTRLPSSLSVRRCSHFGDTMHFIDRLSKISSDLRMIPTQHRLDVLHDNLHELNRRLRRRMVSRGDVSLDVEDHRNAYDWPQIRDLSADMIQYSVHLPLIPQIGTWSNGEPKAQDVSLAPDAAVPTTGVVRILNIVVQDAKLLSSRERCPFLIHVEVCDSGLEGHDARLYAMGSADLGSTIGEALSMVHTMDSSTKGALTASQLSLRENSFLLHGQPNVVPYAIPDELLQHPTPSSRTLFRRDGVADVNPDVLTREEIEYNAFPRGGSQSERQYYDSHEVFSGGYAVDPYDLVRQQEYEQLHHHLYSQQSIRPQSPLTTARPKVTVGSELLDTVFGREWRAKCLEIRNASPFGHVNGWRLASFIMKAGEDIRREAFVMQIISKLQSWFRDEIPEADRPFMRPYTIMCVGGDAGLLECLSDAKSVDEVKKRTDGFTSLRDYFERAYGPPRYRRRLDTFGLSKLANSQSGHVSFETAQENFLRSLVGYSLVCYILQIKDRHNANILLDRLGHIMHIDFGYVLGDTPKMGKVPIFSERAPFKLSADFWDVLGGWNTKDGGLGVKFCKMFELAFQCASSHADEIAALTEAAMLSLDSNPRNARSTANGVRSRLRMRGAPGSREQKMFVMDLVNAALTCWGTSTYDWLQRNMNGYQ
jgi:phosphatidylinositol 4-kinase A